MQLNISSEQSRAQSLPPRLYFDDLLGKKEFFTPPQDTVVTVGRGGTFRIGEDDQFLHRELMRFWYEDNTWYMKNVGTKIPVMVRPRTKRVYAGLTMGSGAIYPVPLGGSAVTFSTRERNYEFHFNLVLDKPQFAQPQSTEITGAETMDGNIKMRDEQIELLIALRSRFYDSGADWSDAPSVEELEDKLGWSRKKIETKINHLYKTLEDRGVLRPTKHSSMSKRLILARYAWEHSDYLPENG
ncbi:hypothetical protein EML15_01260 [Corynebacterium sp. sy017]|uniref:hypothetical protein n=1 Tax=unclassified Corynebacterium TaxID=2624378 RepID=UPI001186B29C|nr:MULTISPECIES: hypothetical protein [unclassified Corynebacterium]MBP3087782.1 hypothetical protein [Corynebacterium sp. sy017]QDZ42758.1 hypothetical protein FQV43_06005 [Corynebacterium sp. sy039]TSD92331.1 hypothetical protein ELY17_01260 [Corynebacterium sp. SY003]